MTLQEAIDLIQPGVMPSSGTWADIGAGTGMFTLALIEILQQGKIIALDKSPHALFKSNIQNLNSNVNVEILEADFNLPLNLPPLDGIVMANALHYATGQRDHNLKRTKLDDHLLVLKNVLASLKETGSFILVEYETDTPRLPWVPNPVPFEHFRKLCKAIEYLDPVIIGRRKSIYGYENIYAARTSKANKLNTEV